MKKRNIQPYLPKILLIITELWGLVLCAQETGTKLFVYYTEDSNILALLSCMIYITVGIVQRKRSTDAPPRWVMLLKYAAVSATTLTFLVVLFVLIPMTGKESFGSMLFGGSMLFHHTVCPLLMIADFVFFDREFRYQIRSTVWALLPTLLYAAVAIPLNILGVWRGPYPFLLVHEQSVMASILWSIVIVGGAYGIIILLRPLRNLPLKKRP